MFSGFKFTNLLKKMYICNRFILQDTMNFIGNVLWFILGGFLTALMYFIGGIVLCITIIGIPFGLQLFKFARYALWPFGHDAVSGTKGTGCLSLVMNIVWLLLGWWEIAAVHIFCGLLFCITIIGIPFGLQHFKIAIAAFFPFGKEIQ